MRHIRVNNISSPILVEHKRRHIFSTWMKVLSKHFKLSSGLAEEATCAPIISANVFCGHFTTAKNSVSLFNDVNTRSKARELCQSSVGKQTGEFVTIS